MPSLPASEAERIDWRSLDDDGPRVGWQGRTYAVGVAALAILYGYVSFVRTSDAPVAGFWDPTYHDWLILLGLLTFACFACWPLAADRERTRTYWRRLRANPPGLVAFGFIVGFVLVGTIGPFLVGERSIDLYVQYQPPVFLTSPEKVTSPCVGPMVDGVCHGTWRYPLGTDGSGLDVIWLIVVGSRISLLVALVAVVAIAPVATLVGVLAGYYGGRVDAVLMRYVDVQEALPAFVVYVFVAAVLGESLLLLLVAFGLLSWGGVARLVRSETLQRKEDGYVRAARSAGASRWTVVRRHLVPNVSSTALTATTQLIPRLILTEAAASFLYLTHAGLPSWGATLSQGLSGKYAAFPPIERVMNPAFLPPLQAKWWVAAFTTLALAATVLAFAVFGDALRDVLDPRAVVGDGDG